MAGDLSPTQAPARAPQPGAPEEDAREARARGDLAGALTILMNAYGERIYGFCRAALGDPVAAQDVQQTVFVEAFRDLGRWKEQSSLLAWLYAIARHRCLDAAKARRRWYRRFVGSERLPDVVAPGAPGSPGSEPIGGRVGADALERCLKELRPHVRMAVLLRFGEELPFKEIAWMSREHASAVQMRVMRALPLLRRCLEKGLARAG